MAIKYSPYGESTTDDMHFMKWTAESLLIITLLQLHVTLKLISPITNFGQCYRK
jgi:hypothetical protein